MHRASTAILLRSRSRLRILSHPSLLRSASLEMMSRQQSTGNSPKRGSTIKRYGTTALIASATASITYGGYFFFSSAAIPAVSGESVVEETDINTRKKAVFKEQKFNDPTFNYEYVGFDSYPGIDLDDGTGVASAEVKAAAVANVQAALDQSEFDDNMRGTESTTLDSNHALRLGIGQLCPTYGCPFLPSDVHFNEDTKAALEKLRKSGSKDSLLLDTSGKEKAATLTLIGYKGGKMEDQINQDRAFVLSPFALKRSTDSKDEQIARLLGVFDGHARYGERVSEYVVKTLPALLRRKLLEKEDWSSNEMGHLLNELFIELDASSPAEPSGGCTASIVLQIGTNIYIANAGDSRSFVAVHIIDPISKTETTQIIYGTREDKPHLSFERLRVEAMVRTQLNFCRDHGYIFNFFLTCQMHLHC